MILNDFVNRFERWIKASHKVAHIETFMVPNIQGLGQLDEKLIVYENEFLPQSSLPQDEETALNFSEHLTLSYLWVLGVYEIVRSINQKIGNTNSDEKLKKLKNLFTRLRVPLAKYEPAKYHKATDSKIAYPIL